MERFERWREERRIRGLPHTVHNFHQPGMGCNGDFRMWWTRWKAIGQGQRPPELPLTTKLERESLHGLLTRGNMSAGYTIIQSAGLGQYLLARYAENLPAKVKAMMGGETFTTIVQDRSAPSDIAAAGDGRRLQCRMADPHAFRLAVRIRNAIHAETGCWIIPTTLALLARKPGCSRQSPHRDAEHGWFMIIPLVDKYELWLAPGSMTTNEDIKMRSIILNKGQVIVVNARCVHAGGRSGTASQEPPVMIPYNKIAVYVYLVHEDDPMKIGTDSTLPVDDAEFVDDGAYPQKKKEETPRTRKGPRKRKRV